MTTTKEHPMQRRTFLQAAAASTASLVFLKRARAEGTGLRV